MEFRHPFLSLVFFAGTYFVSAGFVSAADVTTIQSPNAKISVRVQLGEGGIATYTVETAGKQVLEPSRLGLVREDSDFSSGLSLRSAGSSSRVEQKYEIFTSKRRENHYVANRQVLTFANAAKKEIEVIFQVSDDGVGFQYRFPEKSDKMHRIIEERSTFNFPAEAVAWLQPIAEAKSGWSQTNPSYEEYYEKEIPVGTPSPSKAGWIYPALFRSGETWLVVSETGLGRNYCGTRLHAESPQGEYRIAFPDPRESFRGGAVLPESKLPWSTPWRVIAIGSLAGVVESNLGVHLADPAPQTALAKSKSLPGKASWSWPLLKDERTVFDVQKQFIDYAADMGWGYTLIDALWDKQIGYDKLKELVDYGRSKGVKVLVWYNSAGDWNTAPQTPRDMMHLPETRAAEFKKLRDIGVAGLKIDFFGGDGQSMIAYYHDLLKDTAEYGFSVNFHGCTLPRGWQRTYPHLMTMEAIRGLEYVTFEQKDAEQEPSHATMLPFTRNVFDPMDFTPVVLDRIDRIERRTTAAFELALSVLFFSGIQHYAEIPEGMAKAPDYVRDFLRSVPSVWDDIRFVSGYPGKNVVIARRAGDRWYVAGINGEKQEQTFTLDLTPFAGGKTGRLITDGADALNFGQREIAPAEQAKLQIKVPAHGGFVFTTN